MAVNPASRLLRPGDILVVLHDFDARSNDELTLRKSDRVQLIELDDGFGDGWYLGNHLSLGRTGLFPGVYTTKAPSAPVRNPGHSRTNSATAHQTATVPTSAPPPYVDNASTLPPILLPDASQRPSTTPLMTESPSQESFRASQPAPHHTTYVQRSIGEALREDGHRQDSPVMNETLSVIDEHIEHLSTPRQSLAPAQAGDDSESEYSSRLERHSYVAGPETDEEDNGAPEEAIVRSWDHVQTANHLRELGLDPKHCDIFEEQEISGDVLLDMDQSFINMKEYDFGVMGRRLKTWHKIRDFQQSVKGSYGRSKHTSEIDQDSLSGSRQNTLQQRSSSNLRPSVDQTNDANDMPHPLKPGQGSKRMSWSANTPPTSWRSTVTPDVQAQPSPDATSDSKGHSRRHSSIDFGNQPDLELASVPSITSHRHQSSYDRTASLTGSHTVTTPASSLRPPRKQDSFDNSQNNLTLSPIDLDRGYFSGNEVDNRKARNRLSKRESSGAAHSRQSSYTEQQAKRLSAAVKRHSRLGSLDSAQNAASQAYTAKSPKTRFRSASTLAPNTRSMIVNASPTVTNLEDDSSRATGPVQEKQRMQDRARRFMGFRATSDTTSSQPISDRANSDATTPGTEMTRFDLNPPTPTESATPSLTSKSLDIDSTDTSLKATDSVTALPVARLAQRPRIKGKQRTSAYTHGLLKIPPAEAMLHCDYSGWMRKKSSGVMTTWKPRLFILRGRRLSYYYSEKDTEERGIIDISGHKVLVANNDPIITIHATITGATKPSRESMARQSSGGPPLSSKILEPGAFFFKLVPPKTGMSRAVQFTKPTVHYFQVDSATLGRKWMGEIMKATIEHDLTSYETTNKQKTISLAKARARRERPPALGDTKAINEAKALPPVDTGLNISGVQFQDPAMGNKNDPTSPVSPNKPQSPKALAMLGLGPSLSQRSSKRSSFDGKRSKELEQAMEGSGSDKENEETLLKEDVTPLQSTIDKEVPPLPDMPATLESPPAVPAKD